MQKKFLLWCFSNGYNEVFWVSEFLRFCVKDRIFIVVSSVLGIAELCSAFFSGELRIFRFGVFLLGGEMNETAGKILAWLELRRRLLRNQVGALALSFSSLTGTEDLQRRSFSLENYLLQFVQKLQRNSEETRKGPNPNLN